MNAPGTPRGTRLVTLDFGGYPYPLALSRALARRGYEVLHLTFAGLTPRTSLAPRPDDPEGLTIEGIELGEPYAKYRFVTRWRQERRLAGITARRVAAYRPDVVMVSNTPLDVESAVMRECRRAGVGFVFWLQDLIGVATHAYVRKRLPVVGEFVGRYYIRMEDRLLRRSDRVIAITEDFLPLLRARGVDPARTVAIENWAPIEELPVRPRDNAWARSHGLEDKLVFLYAGTLGLKHRPDLLLRLAEQLRDRPDARVVVCSEGPAMDLLRAEQERLALPNLTLLPLQPYEAVPDTMASGDVLVALLEPTAASFSVPSKVQTYLCAGRPVLLAIPPANLASRLVAGAECGVCVDWDDTAGFLEGAARLAGDPGLREEMGARARRLAQERFDAEAITDRFQTVIEEALASRPGPA